MANKHKRVQLVTAAGRESVSKLLKDYKNCPNCHAINRKGKWIECKHCGKKYNSIPPDNNI